MFTKINAALISFGIAFIFLYVWWKNKAIWKSYISQFVIFFAICAPIGLCMPVRNYLNYHIPFTYFQKVGVDSSVALINSSVWKRIGIVFDRQLCYAFTAFDMRIEQNIWIQTVRTALFDEMQLDTANNLAGAWRFCCYG